MKVVLDGHENYYGLSDVVRLFFGPPLENREQGYLECAKAPEWQITSRVKNDTVETLFNGEKLIDNLDSSLPVKREVKRQLYAVLSMKTNKSFPWGALTGIRPTIVAREETSSSELTRKYFVREDKAELAMQTAKAEDEVLALQKQDALNIYVGVPFCPSRCEYCSFVSQDITKHLKSLGEYALALKKEIREISKSINREVDTVYFGGGTPTVFEDKEFESILECFFEKIKLTGNAEITVEAGRPDTITEYKLKAMKRFGVRRICINPQTMCDETLSKLNRKHTCADTIECYKMARKLGFEVINMDLIAGLKYENADELIKSVEALLELAPENITIHSLYKKRRANISREDCLDEDNGRGSVDDAVKTAYELLDKAGYYPYYMYRQKDTGYGLENVGFSTKGTECLYNVAMMSDKRDVLAFGAGAMSKRAFDNGRIERCPCIKDALGYIADVDKSIAKKKEFFEL